MIDDGKCSNEIFSKINSFDIKNHLKNENFAHFMSNKYKLGLCKKNIKLNNDEKNLPNKNKINNNLDSKIFINSSIDTYLGNNKIKKNFKRTFSSLSNMEFLPIYRNLSNNSNIISSVKKSYENNLKSHNIPGKISRFKKINKLIKSRTSVCLLEDKSFHHRYSKILSEDKIKKIKSENRNNRKTSINKKAKIIFDNFIQKYMSEMKTGLKIIKRDKNGNYNIFQDKFFIKEELMLNQFNRNNKPKIFYNRKKYKTTSNISNYQFKSLSQENIIKNFKVIFDKSRKTFRTEKKKRIKFNLKSNSIFQKYDSNKMYEKDKRLLQEMKKKMEQNFNKRPIFVSNYSTNNLKIIKL